MDKYKYVIIGSGAAGINAADSIHQADSGQEILVITEESVSHYYRPKLIDYVADKADFDSFKFYNDKWYEDRKIKMEFNQRVVKIDTGNKKIITDKNNEFTYEKLLIASGGYAFVPPPFRDIDYLTVRIKKDADKVIESAKENKKWCVIGGGLLGLELANALQNRGCEVTVIEVADFPLPKQLDKEGGEFLKRRIQSLGIEIITGIKIKEITPEKVKLVNDNEINYEKLLFCTGIRPDIGFAEEAGIETDKAVKINDFFETNIEDIYAAGDSCIYEGNLYGLWMPALEQGKLAGKNMAGQKTRYNGSDPVYKLKVVGVDMVSVGTIDSAMNVKISDKNAGVYRKAFIDDDKLVGFILYGDTSNENNIKKNLNKDFSLSEKYFDKKETQMSNEDTYMCGICGYVYSPAKGDPDNGVAAGTPFEDLPDDWNCPVCGAPQSQFSKN